MTELPMVAPTCSLDAPGLAAQLARYRAAGRGARLIERSPQRLVVALRRETAPELVAELIAIERECCPFFEFEWLPSRRRLTIAVPSRNHSPALQALSDALGLDAEPAQDSLHPNQIGGSVS